MANDVSKIIIDALPAFSKSQRKIANYILNNYDKAAYMTAARLALTTGISESTVVRFARELGFSGYSEFQLALQELARNKLTHSQRIEVTKQRLGTGDVIANVMEADINKIKHTLENLDRKSFYSSVDAILAAKTVYIMGVRSSEPIARLLNHSLSLIFDNVKFVQPTSVAEVFEQMFSISEHDVLIAFSFPRYSSKVVSAVKYANSRNAQVIGITDSESSPLAEHANYLLLAESDMASYMDSLVAPVSIINAIIIEITSRREKEITKRFDTLEEVWDEYDVYAKR